MGIRCWAIELFEYIANHLRRPKFTDSLGSSLSFAAERITSLSFDIDHRSEFMLAQQFG
jgi:hypothetical protein